MALHHISLQRNNYSIEVSVCSLYFVPTHGERKRGLRSVPEWHSCVQLPSILILGFGVFFFLVLLKNGGTAVAPSNHI